MEVATARALSGEAGGRGVRAMLVESGRSALHDMLRSMTGNDRTLRSSRLRYAKFKPGQKLTAYYDVAFDRLAQPAPVAATWFYNGSLDAMPGLAAAQRELDIGGGPTPFSRHWATDTSRGLLVLAAPLDPAFPGLGRLSDPARVSEVLASCMEPPAHGDGRFTVRAIRYRPGQRHVLQYRAGEGPRIYAKLYRVGGAHPVAGAVSVFAALLESAGIPGVRAVRPAAVLGDAEAILYRHAPGMPLSRWLRTGKPVAPGQFRTIGRLLQAVHAMPAVSRAQLREHHLDDEIDEVYRVCAAMIGLRPDLGATARHVVECAHQRLLALEAEPVSVVHGDMKADHLFSHPDLITVLDTDKCSLADPALDIGKLLADLRWWSWVSGYSHTAAEAEFLAGYGGSRQRLARARLYAALLLVKIAGRRISVAHHSWASRTKSLLALAANSVDGEVP